MQTTQKRSPQVQAGDQIVLRGWYGGEAGKVFTVSRVTFAQADELARWYFHTEDFGPEQVWLMGDATDEFEVVA